MPTPFMHLQLSEEMRSLALSTNTHDSDLLRSLSKSWPAFYLGSVAPDYQTICGIPRAATHFYGMPPESEEEGWQNMLEQYPYLFPGKRLKPDQAAFIAAYLVHLWLDLNWYFRIVVPYFIENPDFTDLKNSYLLHVTLLAYLDDWSYRALPDTAPLDLVAAQYNQWLPFLPNDQLEKWRDYLVAQLVPNAKTETVPIFAARLQMTPEEFVAKLNDTGWMERELFSRIPVEKLKRHLMDLVPECLARAEAYLNGHLA